MVRINLKGKMDKRNENWKIKHLTGLKDLIYHIKFEILQIKIQKKNKTKNKKQKSKKEIMNLNSQKKKNSYK